MIGFLGGCIGSVIFEKQNRQAVELLSASGYDVCSPWRQQCCGAIAHHNGDWDTARKFARKNIDRFLPENGIDLKFITCNIAGCGSMLREYEHLLRHAGWSAVAARYPAGAAIGVIEARKPDRDS